MASQCAIKDWPRVILRRPPLYRGGAHWPSSASSLASPNAVRRALVGGFRGDAAARRAQAQEVAIVPNLVPGTSDHNAAQVPISL